MWKSAGFVPERNQIADEIVVIPDGLIEIKYNTFYGCSSLDSVHFLNNVKIIGGEQNHHFVNSFLQNLFFTALTVWRYNKLDLMGDSLYSGSLPAKSWRLIQDGEGVHIYERCVVYGSDYMPIFNQDYTLAYSLWNT